MTHPFQSIALPNRKYVFFPAVAVLLLVQIYYFLDKSLYNATAPLGIISFELARTVDNSRAILASWEEVGRIHAGFSLGIDYVYILAYSNLIALACVWSSGVLQKRKWRGANLGALLAWGAWLAGLFDSTENAALLVQLFNSASSEWAFIAWFCASIKFSLIALGLGYAAYGGVGWLVNKLR